jgi:hypothetical protein
MLSPTCGNPLCIGPSHLRIERRSPLRGEDAQKFIWRMVRVDEQTGCWHWLGQTTPAGYGHIRISRQNVRAHRFAYEAFHGPIPDGLFVLHRRDVKDCVAPHHLYAGSAEQNAADAMDRHLTLEKDLRERMQSYSRDPAIREKRDASRRLLDVKQIEWAILSDDSAAELAEAWGFGRSGIGRIRTGGNCASVRARLFVRGKSSAEASISSAISLGLIPPGTRPTRPGQAPAFKAAAEQRRAQRAAEAAKNPERAATGAMIRQARNLLGWPQAKLARAVGIPVSAVCSSEQGLLARHQASLRRALEAAGAQFGSGSVCLRSAAAPDGPEPSAVAGAADAV